MFSSIFSVLLVILLLHQFAQCEKQRFDNYTLYRIVPKNEEQIILLQELQNDVNYDFWKEPTSLSEFVNIMAKPDSKLALEGFLNNFNIDFEIAMSNVQEFIDKEKIRTYNRNNIRSMRWDEYYKLADIEAWLEDLVAEYPDILTPIVGGISYEGRDIKGVKLSHGDSSDRRVIFVESGIHSREWITVTFACYLLNELLTSTDAETIAAAEDFDWYIFPITNPDGYYYTHEVNRMWRKNRRPIDGTNYGVDLNRNWNNNWMVVGASSNPIAENYAGAGPFSEAETRSLSQFIETIGDKIDLYLSFHSYGHLLLIPYGNTTDPLANYYEAMSIGRRAAGALSVRYGTQYKVGNIAEAIYAASGNSMDWVKEEFKVPLLFCYELRDNGYYGFILPEEEILPNHLEVMDSVLELIHQAKRFGVMSGGSQVLVSVLLLIFGLNVLLL